MTRSCWIFADIPLPIKKLLHISWRTGFFLGKMPEHSQLSKYVMGCHHEQHVFFAFWNPLTYVFPIDLHSFLPSNFQLTTWPVHVWFHDPFVPISHDILVKWWLHSERFWIPKNAVFRNIVSPTLWKNWKLGCFKVWVGYALSLTICKIHRNSLNNIVP